MIHGATALCQNERPDPVVLLMKIRVLYKNKIIAKKFFEEHGSYDSEFKTISFSTFLLFLNCTSIYFIFAIIFPGAHKLINEFFRSLAIPTGIYFVVISSLLAIFIKVIRGCDKWDVISRRDIFINRIYTTLSLAFLPFILILTLFY